MKTLTNPMKHYIVANYYGEMRVQKHKKNFCKWQYKLKGQRINIGHCVLPTYHEILEREREYILDKHRPLGLYYTPSSSFISMALGQVTPNEFQMTWARFLFFLNRQTKSFLGFLNVLH